MWHLLPARHKVGGAYVGSFIVADKTIDTVREHFFLAAHEWLTHSHLLPYSLATVGAVTVAGVIWHRRRKGKEDKPAV